MPSTLSSATNVNLNSLDTLRNYSVSLTGNGLQAIAHTPSLAAGGDTLVALGNYDTLIGGAGPDSLVALGMNDLLMAGSGANTLVGGRIAGSVSVLVGNGKSVLQYAGANNVFSLTSGTTGDSSTSRASRFFDSL
jgi:Ca2+-binding RTX toxin-like protein